MDPHSVTSPINCVFVARSQLEQYLLLKEMVLTHFSQSTVYEKKNRTNSSHQKHPPPAPSEVESMHSIQI